MNVLLVMKDGQVASARAYTDPEMAELAYVKLAESLLMNEPPKCLVEIHILQTMDFVACDQEGALF